jgi:hypothetical protein
MSDSKWIKERITIATRRPHPLMQVDGWVSPSRRWHVRRMHAGGWKVTHMPTGLGAFERDGLLREVRAYLDRMDHEVLGPVRRAEECTQHAGDMIARAIRVMDDD